MGLREHITSSRAHCAADGSTAPDATTGERGDRGAAGRADGATAEGSLLGLIHACTAGEPEAQDQDCGKRTPAAAAHVLNLHPTSFVPALRAQLWIVLWTTGGYSIYSRHSGPLAVPSNELRALRCRRRDLGYAHGGGVSDLLTLALLVGRAQTEPAHDPVQSSFVPIEPRRDPDEVFVQACDIPPQRRRLAFEPADALGELLHAALDAVEPLVDPSEACSQEIEELSVGHGGDLMARSGAWRLPKWPFSALLGLFCAKCPQFSGV